MAEKKKEEANNLVALKGALAADSVKSRFAEMLGKKSAGFLTSISSVVNNNELLQKADVNSIILAAGQAAAVDLPINPNLGFAAIIPFNDTKNNRCLAQFQIMRDGWVELALRTGQVSAIENEVVHEGELVYKNKFTGEYRFDENARKSDKVIGYMAYIRLTNGFEKYVYWSKEECKAHALRYSQTFKKGFGMWKDNFDAMALKTVLKHLIKKYTPKSIEMLGAIASDSGNFSGGLDTLGNAQPISAEDVEDTVAEEVVDTDTGEVKVLNAPDNKPKAPADEAPSQEQPAAPESGDDDF